MQLVSGINIHGDRCRPLSNSGCGVSPSKWAELHGLYMGVIRSLLTSVLEAHPLSTMLGMILLLFTMSPQNHEKQRFWPPKNQVIYHKHL